MNKNTIGLAELDLLKFIASNGPSTVRVVADHFAVSKGYQRATVMKMMERLRAKGFLLKRANKGGFLYSSTTDPSELDQDLIERLVDGPLGGSIAPMVRYLVERRKLSDDELEDLKRLVEKLEKER